MSLSGPVNSKRRKADLVKIAEGLSLDSTGTIRELVPRINAHLQANQQLSTDPRFQQLFSYRSGEGSGGQALSKETGKNSADKAADDMAEQHKSATSGTGTATGASKKLLEHKILSDPPPQFQPLRVPVPRTPVKPPHRLPQAAFSLFSQGAQDDNFESGSSPEPSATPIVLDDDDDDLSSMMETLRTPSKRPKEGYKNTANKGTTPNFVVTFHDHNNHTAPAQEVWVPGGVPVQHEHVNGADSYFVRLSDLLPLAIEQSTPIKARGGRLFRPGLAADKSRIQLGSISALLEPGKSLPLLKMERVNKYRLNHLRDGDEEMLTCDVFIDAPAAMPNTASSSGGGDTSSHSLTGGPGTAVIQKTAYVNPRQEVGNPQANLERFIGFLRELLGGSDSEWRKAKNAGDILERYLAVKAAVDALDDLGWNRSTGGYMVPKDYDSIYAGRTFTKEEVHYALNVKHTQANNDAALFKPRLLAKLPDLKAC
ncbi:hypothetical protein B0H21DRAFT_838358 [Amylocystis lapponica]|nr:hypothetical protein B0H21DRAFT_838358 [Amylocystis lapponica]